jgi:radical SAM protein with 4Fe4S-binding SPASM domain
MLKDTFCSSPWFHIKIDPNGNFIPCRWDFSFTTTNHNIKNTSLLEYFNSDIPKLLRMQLLNGENPKTCQSCRYEDQMKKVSGRQRQLLKSAINIENFDKTFCASPHWQQFKYSYDHQGLTKNQPVDLQIDLGNTCNSACIMCTPTYSSRLAADYHKLNPIEPNLFKNYAVGKNWTDDNELVDKFIDEISTISNIRYIHFLGGETLYLKSFYKICNKLIELGKSKNISIGTTTNCTICDAELENIIKNFKQVHLGLSIEAFHFINDYIRYPSDIDQIWDNIEYFLKLREKTGLHLSLRITPNILSIYHIDSIFEFMLTNKIIAESCNILSEPTCLRVELLPDDLRQKILNKINKLIVDYKLSKTDEVIVNRRRDDLIYPVITSVIYEYKTLLENYQTPENVEEERYNLIRFIKGFESLRNNKILNYLPEYEEFLRSYGY